VCVAYSLGIGRLSERRTPNVLGLSTFSEAVGHVRDAERVVAFAPVLRLLTARPGISLLTAK